MNDNYEADGKAPERAEKHPKLTRRGLAKASLAAPVVLSVTTRPAWGTDTCTISGLMSGNLSRPTTTCSGGGCTPGFWKNNWRPWTCTGYSPGSLTCLSGQTIDVCPKNKLRVSFTASGSGWGQRVDTWGTMFGCAPPIGSGYVGTTPLLAILRSSHMNIPKTFAKHAVAAMLNASCNAVAYGSTPGDLRTAICNVSSGGTYAGMGMGDFANLLDRWNNRGCPISANQMFSVEQNLTVTIDNVTYQAVYDDVAQDKIAIDDPNHVLDQ